ncbi:MAG TPA: hypothetical protein VIX35_01225, partial [Vicinamibacterales bacterium]
MKSHSKAPRGLVALGAAAVIAVYAAGFVRTRSAAARWLPDAPGLRRPAVPAGAGGPSAPTVPADLQIRPRVAARPTSVTLPHTPTRKPVARITATAQTTPPPLTSVTAPASDAGTTDTATPAAEVNPAPKSPYRDGTYSGWGSSRHGDIQA